MDPLTDNDISNMAMTRYEGFQFVWLLYFPFGKYLMKENEFIIVMSSFSYTKCIIFYIFFSNTTYNQEN